MLKLAKPALDVGLFTNQRDAMLHYWQQQVGLTCTEMLPLGGGLQQHRHAIGDSVLKLNHARETLPDAAPGGIRRLLIARDDVATPQELTDPDGNRVLLVPRGHEGIEQLQVELTVSDLTAHQSFYPDALGLPVIDPVTFACGVSRIRLVEGEARRDPVHVALGFRYLTLQVFDVVGTHRAILGAGGREGRPPVRLGEVAYISFVRDPDGNWIEISQRKSLTGSLA